MIEAVGREAGERAGKEADDVVPGGEDGGGGGGYRDTGLGVEGGAGGEVVGVEGGEVGVEEGGEVDSEGGAGGHVVCWDLRVVGWGK